MEFLLVLVVAIVGYYTFPKLRQKIKLMEGASDEDAKKAFEQERLKQKQGLKSFFKLIFVVWALSFLGFILLFLYMLR